MSDAIYLLQGDGLVAMRQQPYDSEDVLQAALARPRQRWSHERQVSLPELAAAVAFGLARNHPYVDGNKRVALVVMAAFLERNGVELTASNAEVIPVVLAVAARELTEPELARWIDEHSRDV